MTEEEILPFPEENRHDWIDFIIEQENKGNVEKQKNDKINVQKRK